ncbi:MAG TPA: outer membrane lipoprotein carrier protein LolA [Smithellaceae bacterium]|nr:outer membrane lipoprotein carrier protein LolA [Smithellaceae bacterium]HRY37343.1 outer membrane lipoprotein carrier protein LolA [Smithellaceae bacterium]
MKKVFLVLLILLMLVPASVRADNFERLRRDSSRISTISADFVQKKFMKILSKPLVSEGKFYYTAPDSIRWEYSQPIKSVVISDKGNTKRYIASGGKMVEDKTGGAQAMKIVLDEVAGWMSGKFTSNPSFTATLKEGSNTQITLTPVGKSMAGMIEKIEITVTRKDASIKSVRIVESATAETRIDFQHVVINQEIQPSVFQDVQ